MTPAEEALRDAFLSECWRPVREYHQTADERANAWSRQQGVNGAGEKAAESSRNVVARLRDAPLTCNNEETTKDGPGGCANTRTPGPNPRVSEGYGMSTPRATHPCHGVR